MKIINPIIKNCYSCQLCGKEFESNEEYNIIPGEAPICSNRCVFKKYYRIFADFDIKELVVVANSLKMTNFSIVNKNSLVFDITKKYKKDSLTTINSNRQIDIDKNKWTRSCPYRQIDKKNPPMNIGGCLFVCPKLPEVQENNLVHNSKGGLTQWF